VAAPLDAEGRRLLWRCRRGLKELDVLLERYAAAHLGESDPGQRRRLERLLELPDPQLAEYLLAGVTPQDAELAALARQILRTAGGGSAPGA
jgi:antitoxin CptB